MRLLGLDIGQKTIGVAVGEVLASELTTLRTGKNGSFYASPEKDRAIEEINMLKKREEATGIVVGLPVDEEGALTEEAEKIRAFADQLKDACLCPIHFTNETLTSFMARDILEGEKATSSESAKREDQLAAQLILQQYLEENALA